MRRHEVGINNQRVYRKGKIDRETAREVTNPSEPRRYFVLAVSANVGLNYDDGQEHGQRDEDHIHTEVSTCYTRHVGIDRVNA